jgi:hypothetical protein
MEVSRMDKHITVVAILHIGLGILGVFLALGIWIGLLGAGILSADPDAMRILSFIGTLVGFFLLLISIPEIIGGIGLLKKRPWSRILLLVVSVLELIHIPLGTALGIYTIWVLIQYETKSILEAEPSAGSETTS